MPSPMIFEDPEFLETAMEAAILRAVEIGWHSPVDHGFCCNCEIEKPVFDVIARDAPSQPPRCMECFVAVSSEMYESLLWDDFVDGH